MKKNGPKKTLDVCLLACQCWSKKSFFWTTRYIIVLMIKTTYPNTITISNKD